MLNRTRQFDFLRLSLALTFALVAAAAAGLVYLNRDFLFEWQRVKAVGKFTAEEDPILSAAALQFAQEKIARPGASCVGQWIGKDERFLYMTVGCARIEEKLGEVVTIGDANFHPTRFRHDGRDIENWEQPNEEEYANSMRRLFPKEAVERLKGRLNRELYLKLLRAKQAPTP
jgi:hypothetical protein